MAIGCLGCGKMSDSKGNLEGRREVAAAIQGRTLTGRDRHGPLPYGPQLPPASKEHRRVAHGDTVESTSPLYPSNLM